MNKKIFIDTNIFLRYLLDDHPKQSPAAKKLFERAVSGEMKLITLPIVIAEIIWVLLSFTKEPKEEVVRKLKLILLFRYLEIVDRDILVASVELFERKNIDFIDAYISSWIKDRGLSKICSFDRDFDEIDGLERIEP